MGGMASGVSLIPYVLGEIRRVMEKHKELKSKLDTHFKSLKTEMAVVAAFLLKEGDVGFHGAVQETRILQLQELAYEVEDFIVGLWEPEKYGYATVAIGTDRRPQLLESIAGFKDRISSLHKEWKLSDESGKKSDAPDEDAAAPSYDSAGCKDPEVIETPKKKLLELLSTSPAELRVISIVGCRGVGKTTLARAVYEDPDVCSQFGYVAWFEASGCKNADDLLSKAPEKRRKEAGGADSVASLPDLPAEAPEEGSKEALGADSVASLRDLPAENPEKGRKEAGGADSVASLRDLPADKRYLVFINDVQQAHMWKDTVRALLEKCEKYGISNRIIMTTSVHSVSTACSSGSYVYRMECLGQDESEDLFWRKVYGCQYKPPRGSPLDVGSKSIFSKCDGLPLALSSVAKYLGANADRLERRDCEDMGRDLGTRYLSGDHDVFMEMQRSLVQCCHRLLPNYYDRVCLLYLSVFPRAHHIKNKSLVRRLMAEGLTATTQDGSKCVNMLIDNCIVDAVQFSSDSRDAKRCRVHGIVLEYIIQKSVSRNIVALIQEEGMKRVDSAMAQVRRLSIQSSNQGTCAEIPTGISLSDVRSLTIFNSVSNFRSCKMLRLLDLEGCTWIANDFQSLDGISGLFLLRYLSLRNTGVKRLPTQMEKLQCLETLDIREDRDTETEVKKLPLEVIMLPKLAYLFGKFELPDVPKVTNTVLDFLTKKSKLQTLAGFVVVARRTRALEQLILQAPKLKKVKVWCNDTSAGLRVSGSPAHLLPSRSDSASPCGGQQLKRKFCTLSSSKTKEQTLNQNLSVDRAEETGTASSSMLLPRKCFTSLESVSIVSSALCKGFLGSLEGTCMISSIKLWGELDRLPGSTQLEYLDKINKLQLISSGLRSEDLSALQKLPGLEYLKIVEDGDVLCNGIFKVEKDGFQSLKRLCIKAPNIPILQFMEGAMGFVISLHLLCPDSSQTELAARTIEGFSHLTRLNDVVLHASASEDAIQAWETVANQHPKRPSVVKLGAE